MSGEKKTSTTIPVKIVSRWDDNRVLFCADVEESVPIGKRIMAALILAVRSGANLSDANLSGVDLRYANLSRAFLYGANLSGADLRYAYLSGANLFGTNLSDANLRYANLSGADLSHANLFGTNLSDANLSDANLRYANLSDANLRYANLSDANLRYANLSGADLYGAEYRGTKIGSGGLLKRASRSDGYEFSLFDCEDGQHRIEAGCRWFTLKEAWKHWSDTRDGTDLGEETFDILVMFEHHAARRGGKTMKF